MAPKFFYHGILQSNYWKMTKKWSFSYNYNVKLYLYILYDSQGSFSGVIQRYSHIFSLKIA